LIWRLIAPDDPEIYLESVNESKKGGFLSGFFGKKAVAETPDIPDLEYMEGENIDDDLDKSWQGIHFCLNKTDYDAEPPMDFLTVGGKTAGDVEVGYGSARLFDSETVKEIEKRISNITTEQLYQNYNPAEMENLDIYPNIWEREGDEGFEYIAEYFESLKSFVVACSSHNMGMAVYLC
jgi:hypothetical protein